MAALVRRYSSGTRAERGLILDEFTLVAGIHRKHAMRLLRATSLVGCGDRRPSRRVYGEAVCLALVVLWEVSDRICGKRLCPLIPILVEAMERHGHLTLAPKVRSGLDPERKVVERYQLFVFHRRCRDDSGSAWLGVLPRGGNICGKVCAIQAI
jgi:hypothetical protein